VLSCGLQCMTFPQIDAAAVGVGGDSAGGNLASAVALKARDEALSPPLAFQVLAYPCNDHTMSGSSYSEFAEGYGLTTRAMKWFWGQYLGADAGARPPHVRCTNACAVVWQLAACFDRGG
jgi:acetyl esterase